MYTDSCRACLINLGSIPLFSYYKDGIAADVITSVFNVDVTFNEHFPNMLCPPCMENIKRANKTKEIIVSSQITLNRHLSDREELGKTDNDNFQQMSEECLKSISLDEVDNCLNTNCSNLENGPSSISIPSQINQQQTVHNSSSERLSNVIEDNNSESNVDNYSSRNSPPTSILTKLTNRAENVITFSFAESYDCEECEFKTDTYKKLLVHMKSHPGVTLFECELCSKTFKIKSSHNKHKMMKKHPCHDCDKTFCDKSTLISHKIKHVKTPEITNGNNAINEASKLDSIDVGQSNIEPTPQPTFIFSDMYACDKCDVKTDTYKRLLYHMKFHADVTFYECEPCGKEFKVKSKYYNHRVIHRAARPFKCKQCGKRFKGRSNLNQHLLTHKTAFVIPCPKCERMFSHMKGLNSHLLCHNEKTEECEICNKTFKHTTYLKTHLAGVHGVVTGRNRQKSSQGAIQRKYQKKKISERSPCEFCGKLVSTINLKKHITWKHSSEGANTCSYCGKKCHNKPAVTAHMQSHFNTKKIPIDVETTKSLLKYKCDQCDKSFVSAIFLKNHKILHSGLKEHVCSHCGKEFAFKMYLERHVRLLHDTNNPRNFNCAICGKVSTCAAAKKAHMLSHTGETPFHCQFCEAKFVYAKSLRIHMNNKHKSNVNKK